MGAQISLTVVLTLLPFYVLLRYYYRRDVFREPRKDLVRTFLLGCLMTIPAIPIEFGLGFVPLRSAGPLEVSLFSAFAMAAAPEESLKLLVIVWYCARRESFNERMDGIVYGATAALGFAALENILYVASGGLVVAAIRCVTSVPMHAAWGAILGYYVARSRSGGTRLDVWKGWAIAVIAHGLFDFGLIGSGLLINDPAAARGEGFVVFGLLLLFAAVVLLSWLGVVRLIRRLRAEQLARVAEERVRAATVGGKGEPEGATAPGADAGPLEARDEFRRDPPAA